MDLFELMISQSIHGSKLYVLSGRCAMQIECAFHGGGVSRDATSVEECAKGWPRIHA